MNCIETMSCVDMEVPRTIFTQLTIVFLTGIGLASISSIVLYFKRFKQPNLREEKQ